MTKIIKIFAFIMPLLMITTSLSAQKRIEERDPQNTFNEALTLFENENYAAAKDLFRQYLDMTPNIKDQRAVEAKFYEAVSAANMGCGQQLISNFVYENPTSSLSPVASFIFANIQLDNRKYRDAARLYETVDAESLAKTDRAEYVFKKGLTYYMLNDVEKSEKLFKDASMMTGRYQDDACYYYAHIQYVNRNYAEARKCFKNIESSTKYKDVIPVYMMQMDFSNGDFTSVTDKADAVLANADGYAKVELALVIAESWYQKKNYSKALEYYNIAKMNTKRAFPREVEFRIGFCKMKNADFNGAISCFQNVTKKNNDELGQYGSYYLAQCYIETNQEKFARNAFLAAHKAGFDRDMSADALFNYAKLSFIPGVDPFNDAVTQLSAFLDENPDHIRAEEARLMMVHLLLNAKDYNKALLTLERFKNLNAEMQRIYGQLTYDIGVKEYVSGNYDEAIKYFKKTANNNEASSNLRADASYWLADSYLQKKDWANAEKSLMAYIKMPSAERTELYAYVHYNCGYMFFNKGDFSDAAKEFAFFINQGKAERNFEADAWMRIGDCHFMSRGYNKAINAYENASKLDAKNADYALFQIGMGYGALGNMNAKVSSMNSLCEKYKNSSFYDKAMYEKGMAYLSDKDVRSAIGTFDRLVKERPRSSYSRQSLVKIGMLYYNNDQYEQALTALKKVVKDYPNTDESRESLNIIRNICMETNRTQEFFAYTEENGIVTTVSEQDSIAFKTAENFFQEGKYQNALDAVDQYIKHNKNGAYLLKVNYYGLTSLEKLGRPTEAKPYLEYIISQPNNDYTDAALLKIAKMEYDASDFSKAETYYTRLLEITENQRVKTEAMENLMLCAYNLRNYDKTIETGRNLAAMPDLTQNQKNAMNHAVGIALYNKKDYLGAMECLGACAHKDRTALGAEAAYYDVMASWNLKDYAKTEEKVFYISDNFGGYNYWVASSFLVLSDVYVVNGNVFQARETLNSVIENYPDDPHKGEIVDKAQKKLAAIGDDDNEE